MSKGLIDNIEGDVITSMPGVAYSSSSAPRMKIILPAHNKPAKKCRSWEEIKYEASELREFIKTGKFEGRYEKAYAISHAQVSETPLQFFVVSEEHQDKEIVKWFSHWCIINAKIVSHSDQIYWDEACMSFPYNKPKRTYRWNKITVEYYVPFLWTWRKIRRKLIGLPAFMIQHEVDHAEGRNIYH